jgi:uncharacterized protein YceK
MRLMGIAMLYVAALTSGCATYKTISTAETGTAKVLSGTRLDLIAMRGEQPSKAKFKAAPPAYPIADLPLSFALDVLILPLTVPVATDEFLFR